MWKIFDKNVTRFVLMVAILCCVLGVSHEAYAEENASPSVVETEGNIYALSDWASEYISIPSSYLQSFQIQVLNATNVSYRVYNGDSVEVSKTGLVTPKIVTYYWQDMGSYSTATTTPEEGVEYYKITNEISFGTSIIEVIADGKRFQVTVKLCDYSVTYADKVIDDFIRDNFTDEMTIEETLEEICAYPASYNYSGSYSSYSGMIVSGGGDCWASSSLILKLCERLGIEAKIRNGNRDLGAGSGHMNVLAIIGDGDYYELEAGFAGEAPRYYSVTHRTSLFSYYNTTGGICVYQYDGDITSDTVLIVPEKIDSYTVVTIGDKFISGKAVCEVILPNTVKVIGDSAFNSCTNLKTINIPASVTEIGEFVFTNCNALTNFTCSEDNPVYKIEDGILYNKAGTTAFYGPSCSIANLSDKTETIALYAFYYNNNLTEVFLPESVKTLEEGAFAACSNLKKVVLTNVETIGAYAFAEGNYTDGLFFEGDIPDIAFTSAYYTTANVYYPVGNNTWTEELRHDYAGTLTWIPYAPGCDGLCLVDGVWGYYKEGILQNDYTGMAENEYGLWYINEGKIDTTASGLVNCDEDWWYINEGKVDFEYVGLVQNNDDLWYVRDGKIDFTYTGIVNDENGTWYVKEGKLETLTTDLVSVSASASSNTATVGDEITITATAQGESGYYTYSFIVYNRDTKKWARIKDNITSNSYVWKATSAGNRRFYVDVKDITGKIIRSEAIDIKVDKGFSVTAKVNTNTTIVGDNITITATAEGGSGDYTYSFIVYNKDTKKWSRIKNNIISNTYIWNAKSAGNRVFYVDVKDNTGKVVRSKAINVITNPKPGELSVTANASVTELKVGEKLTLTAMAAGGSGEYTYSFIVYNKDTKKWSRIKDNITSSTYTWDAKSAGNRVFRIDVKDSTGKIVKSNSIDVKVVQ